ncbi:hypothetical protein C8Q75DRAFT_758703 [Abortiporus biennis]|nr:hypothetical protein C8Q75DRAFT_758703 [Abortiporus biennis]
MESQVSRNLEAERKNAALLKKIAILQAQLDEKNLKKNSVPESGTQVSSLKRKDDDQNVLALKTPSPKRRRIDRELATGERLPSLFSNMLSSSKSSRPKQTLSTSQKSVSAPSTVLSKLATFAKSSSTETTKNSVVRSTAFSEKPVPSAAESTVESQKRDENLALVEDLELGPVEHKPPFDDPQFQKLEPNSGIRLSCRAIPHDEFQDYLRGRYYLSPSKLYSVIRLLPNKQGYDVPVDGDWVTIAVIAERGPLKFSKAPVGVGKEDQGHDEEKDDTLDDLNNADANDKKPKPEYNRFKGKAKESGPPKPTGKKYVNLKLVDFGCRSGSSSSSGKSVIRGDAFLSLLLFEADRVDTIEEEKEDMNGLVKKVKRKIYRGGSRGAFERMATLKEGSVVALLNPKILRPFQRSGDAPHPTDNILALTPESIDSTMVIGQSQDLGMCKAIKRDGSVCGSWCDKRISDVCDWHIQNAVKQRRAGRAEFTAGTSGLSTSAARKPAYDPQRKWGLTPNASAHQEGGSATYVVSGHVVSNSRYTNSMFISESVGRDAQAKAARKMMGEDGDKALAKLLKRDKEGMQAVIAAREYGQKMLGKEKGEKVKKGQKNEKAKLSKSKMVNLDSSSEDEEEESKPKRNAFSAQLIRNLGFDPTAKDSRRPKDSEVQKKLNALAALQGKRRDIDLGPRPGRKLSTVRAPDVEEYDREGSPSEPLRFPDSDDELEYEGEATFGKPLLLGHSKMVNLESSDDDN